VASNGLRRDRIRINPVLRIQIILIWIRFLFHLDPYLDPDQIIFFIEGSGRHSSKNFQLRLYKGFISQKFVVTVNILGRIIFLKVLFKF